jgi:hypothetical protein
VRTCQFGAYVGDPNSVFMTLELGSGAAADA